MDGLHRSNTDGLAGCMNSDGVSEKCRAPGLIERDPVGDEVPKRLLGSGGVVAEALGRVPVEPAAGILQGLRQIPVIERRVRRYAALPTGLGKSAIELRAGRVELTGAGRKDPGPGNRESIRIHAEIGHDRHIPGIPVVVIIGYVAGRTVRDLAWRVGEGIPNAGAAAVLAYRAFDLVRGRCRPPDKVGWEALHVAPLHFVQPHTVSSASLSATPLPLLALGPVGCSALSRASRSG